MAELTAPGGLLLCILFPTAGADLENGPPFLVSLEDYRRVLDDAFTLIVSRESMPDADNHPIRRGREEIAIFQRRQ
jgi:hypothetical protein